MAKIVDVYTNAVYSNLKPLRANWEPSQPVKLGNFGVLRGQAFQRLGDVASVGIAIGATIDEALNDQKIFSSASDMSVSFNAAGGVAPNPAVALNASVSIAFGSKDSAFFNAAGCSYSMIADKVALGNAIMTLYDQGKWHREWAVITDLVTSKATTVVISSASNAKIVLEAKGNSPKIDLADASIGLNVTSSTNIGYQVIAQAGLTPLIGLSMVQSGFLWWGNDFKPLSDQIMGNPDLGRVLQDSPRIETEPRPYLRFSQLV